MNTLNAILFFFKAKYRAHKIVLAANLKYFKSKLLNSPEHGEQDIIDMTGVKVTDLAVFLLYAYTGEILLSTGNALSLIKDAHQLNEDEIKEACIMFLKQHLRAEDACGAYNFAGAINSVLLKKTASATIIKNFEACSKTTDFLGFDYESLKSMLYDAESDTKSQQGLFEGIVSWIVHDVQSRKDYTDVLLSLIDMSKLTVTYMMKYLENNAHSNDLYAIVQNVILCNSTSKRLKRKQNVVLILQSFKNGLGFQYYEFNSKKWSSLKVIPSRDYPFFDSFAVLDDKLYYNVGNEVYSFNLIGEKIKPIDSLNRHWKFIKYDSVANKWRKCPSMCERRIRPVVTVLDEKLYACGGLDVKSVEVYEPATKNWRKVSSMNKQRDHFLVVAYDGKLFAIGGDTEMTVEVYDPIEDKWQIDQEASSGLQIEHPRGGLISEKCLRQRALKRPPEPSNEAPLNTDDRYREVQQPSKKIKN